MCMVSKGSSSAETQPKAGVVAHSQEATDAEVQAPR